MRPANRFTPTRVGNTHADAGHTTRTPVHPHACGEYAVPERFGDEARFTPTRVGNTSDAGRTVHPRRGEYCRYLVVRVHPHACGEYGLATANEMSSRFTPTRVGNTNGADDFPSDYAVHPHACGEYPIWSQFV